MVASGCCITSLSKEVESCLNEYGSQIQSSARGATNVLRNHVLLDLMSCVGSGCVALQTNQVGRGPIIVFGLFRAGGDDILRAEKLP